MYIIKVKGVAKIPDYVQLRDDKFTLLAYFRVDRPEKSLDKIGLGEQADYKMIGNSIIKLDNVDIFQQKHLVLSNVNLHVDKGDFVWLIGQTGSGKSSLLKVIYGDLNLSAGDGHACGYDLGKITTRDIPFLRRKLGIVFQDFQLLTDRSVEDNLRFVMQATGWTDKKLVAERTLDVLEKVGLRSKLKKMPHELSGGEQQRVVIARALINDPEIILADEPTGDS